MMATLHSPNDYLRVTNKGIYEIIEVCDRQIPFHLDETDFFLFGRSPTRNVLV